MSMSVNVSEAKTHLSQLLERVAAGEHIVIARAGRPIADLVPHQAKRVVIGGLKGQLSYDDEALSAIDPVIQHMFYGTNVTS